MDFDLKKLRESKNMSQADLTAAMNVKWELAHPGETDRFTENMILRMEKDSGNIGLDVLYTITQVFGATFDQLLRVSIPTITSPKVRNNWNYVEELRSEMMAYLSDCQPACLSAMQDSFVEQMITLVNQVTRKTKIACIGRPDSGKSRTLNTLLGKDVLPTNWTPTTSAFVLLKHIDDKPAFFGNYTVMVFKADGEETWNPDSIGDEEYCNNWSLAAGDYDLIRQYGIHGEHEDDENVGAIVAYVDSPILKNCDLIDLPGFNPNPDEVDEDGNITVDKDSLTSARASRMADGFIYLSIANSFLYGDDLTMAQSVLKAMPAIEKKDINDIKPLGNVFFVASQALTVDHGNTASLDNILDKASTRLWALVEDHPAISRRNEQTGYEYTEDTLRRRFFTSEMDSEELTRRFHDEFAAFTEMLPIVQRDKAMEELRLFRDMQVGHFADEAKEYQALIDDFEAEATKLNALEDNEDQRSAEYRKRVYDLTDTINIMRRDTENECAELYEDTISSEHILGLIESNGYKKNKKDMQELVARLNADLENGVTNILAAKADELTPKINEFIKDCGVTFVKAAGNIDINASTFSFNVGRAFAGGLSGVATYGALAAWAATCGNLGGYVIVAKAVSLLAALGIHLGGTAAVISAVSSIGGPVVLGIAAAVLAAVTSILVLGGTWKKLISNKLIKQYNKKNVLGTLIEASDGYWDDTMAAFRAGVEAVESEWKAYLRQFREKVESFDETATLEEIANLNEVISFLNDLPTDENAKMAERLDVEEE